MNDIFFYTLPLSARCWCARENKPDFQGWEERAGGDVQWPKTLLWKYLSGTDCGCKWSVVVFAESVHRAWWRTEPIASCTTVTCRCLLPPGRWAGRKEGVELLALGSGALLLERKNVSLSTHSGCHRPLWRVYVSEWCSCFCFPLVYALILIF